MTVHTETRIVSAPTELIFSLVADVERYPEFLPMWKWARIRRWEGSTIYYTEQEVGFGPIRERFETKTLLSPPASIVVSSSDPLFREFDICWNFSTVQGGCQTNIQLRWQAQSFLLQKGIEVVLPTTAKMMIDAFETRARHASRAASHPAR